jgi:pSer/pThr/pTyr-binding forkhead associated (FHA) protein
MSLTSLYQVLRVLISLALYAFIGLALWMLWQDIKSTRRLIALTTVPAGELVELSGEESHALMPVTSLGRASSNVIALPDPAISLEHALITRREGVWWLEDLHSRNGTHLNSQRLEMPTVITSGDIVSIGHSRFKILIRPPST